MAEVCKDDETCSLASFASGSAVGSSKAAGPHKRDMKAELLAWKQARAKQAEEAQNTSTGARMNFSAAQNPRRPVTEKTIKKITEATDHENHSPKKQTKASSATPKKTPKTGGGATPSPLMERCNNVPSATFEPNLLNYLPPARTRKLSPTTATSGGLVTSRTAGVMTPRTGAPPPLPPSASTKLAPARSQPQLIPAGNLQGFAEPQKADVVKQDIFEDEEHRPEDLVDFVDDCLEAKQLEVPPNSPIASTCSKAEAAAWKAVAHLIEAEEAAEPWRQFADALTRITGEVVEAPPASLFQVQDRSSEKLDEDKNEAPGTPAARSRASSLSEAISPLSSLSLGSPRSDLNDA
eukprot:TRINITY_DN11975_c0_g1_i1.p1 TRINITY_DN11975_c0_g1~~TRINITY_DN11975_c0_g1_i1.p1  ORF type:complete len:364 (+),score=99.22 TRINITY_DN11975_c0_g1_i1:42-1094(+)